MPDAHDDERGRRTAEGEHHVPGPTGPLIRDLRLLGLGVMTLLRRLGRGSRQRLARADARRRPRRLRGRGCRRLRGVRRRHDPRPARRQPVVNTLAGCHVLRVGAVVAAVGVVVLLAVPVLAVGYVGALLWGLGIAVAFPLAMSAAGETPGRGPSAIATVATIAYSGFLVGPPLIGTIAHAGRARRARCGSSLAAGRRHARPGRHGTRPAGRVRG